MVTQQPLKETLRGLSITPLLHKFINRFTILFCGPPQIMLLPMNLNEHLINAASVAAALTFPSQSLSMFRTKPIAPQANGFIADGDAPLQCRLSSTPTQQNGS
jgi:hypothetical protein